MMVKDIYVSSPPGYLNKWIIKNCILGSILTRGHVGSRTFKKQFTIHLFFLLWLIENMLRSVIYIGSSINIMKYVKERGKITDLA